MRVRRAVQCSQAQTISTVVDYVQQTANPAGCLAGHFILQAEGSAARGTASPNPGLSKLAYTRPLPARFAQQLQPPVFRLAGLAIGNGLTDPASQVRSV